jgi:hypothetical protein
MDRKDFIKTCGFACMGGAAITILLQSCTATKIVGGKISGDDLIVPISDFETKAGNEKHYKKYVVVQNDILQYPICVYRINAHTRVQSCRCLATSCNARHMAVSLTILVQYKAGRQIKNSGHFR